MEIATIDKIKQPKVEPYSARTIVIGDIHGTLLALQDVIAKVHLQKEDTLIFLGDYVDGYPQSVDTIRYIMDLSKDYDVICIKGNHDVFLEKYLKTGLPPYGWHTNGGKTTHKAFAGYLKKYPEEYDKMLSFIESLHIYYIDAHNNLFIHGGFDHTRSLYENKQFYGEEIFYNDRDLVQMAWSKENSKHKSTDFIVTQQMFKEIFVGHTTTEIYDKKEYKPLNFLNLWMLDTGAGWAGKVTAMDINTKEYWQSEFTSEYYPDWKHD